MQGLTNAGLLKIKAWVTLNRAGAYDQVTLDLLNAPAPPTYIVWRTWVSKQEIQEDVAYDWTRVDNLTVGKARIWHDMLLEPGFFDPSKPNVRAGIEATWSAAQDAATKASIYAHCKTTCSVVERELADSPTGTTAVPATRTATGVLTLDELGSAEKAV